MGVPVPVYNFLVSSGSMVESRVWLDVPIPITDTRTALPFNGHKLSTAFERGSKTCKLRGGSDRRDQERPAALRLSRTPSSALFTRGSLIFYTQNNLIQACD